MYLWYHKHHKPLRGKLKQMNYTLTTFAQVYGACNYGQSTVGNSTCGTAVAASSGPQASRGLLTNTGFDVILAVTVACAIIFTALVVRFWRGPRAGKS
jgi:hypothetical protein